MGKTLTELYEWFAWDLYDMFGHAYDAFRLIMNDAESVFSKLETDKKKFMNEEERKILIDCIAKKMAPAPVKLRADFEITCFTYKGIDAIREALIHAKKTV